MAIFANVAPSINDTQKQSFYFTIVFTRPSSDSEIDADSFSLSNISISESSHIDISNLVLLKFTHVSAIIAVNIPNNVSGSFKIDLVNTITVDGISQTIDYNSKIIKYDTTDLNFERQTYDITPPADSPTKADLEISTASIETGGLILAQIDLDYDFPAFSESYISVPENVEKGTAVSIDDRHRRWIIPITVPQSGEGEIEIEIAEDSLGFQHAALMAPVQFAPTINLNIALPDNLTILWLINTRGPATGLPKPTEGHNIKITGNNVSKVDVIGLIRPFYHVWSKSTGVLSIRGFPKTFYKDLEFDVIVEDSSTDSTKEPGEAGGPAKASAKINVISLPPAIVKPTNALEFIPTDMNSHIVRINNGATSVSVKGTWLGLDHKSTDEGVEISGTVPKDMFGVDSGDFIVEAENAAGKAVLTKIPWTIVKQVVAPVISSIANVSRTVGYTAFTIQASLSTGTITGWSITGTGASISADGLITIAAGRPIGTHSYKITHTNSAGSDTEDFDFFVTPAPIAPVIAAIANVNKILGYDEFTIQASLSAGTTGGAWIIVGPNSAISNAGIITISEGLMIGTHNYTVTHANVAGSDTENFSVRVSSKPVPAVPRIGFVLSRGDGFFIFLRRPTGLPLGDSYDLEVIDPLDVIKLSRTIAGNTINGLTGNRSVASHYDQGSDLVSGTWTIRFRSSLDGVKSAWATNTQTI